MTLKPGKHGYIRCHLLASAAVPNTIITHAIAGISQVSLLHPHRAFSVNLPQRLPLKSILNLLGNRILAAA
jgi:hypothetical protein